MVDEDDVIRAIEASSNKQADASGGFTVEDPLLMHEEGWYEECEISRRILIYQSGSNAILVLVDCNPLQRKKLGPGSQRIMMDTVSYLDQENLSLIIEFPFKSESDKRRLAETCRSLTDLLGSKPESTMDDVCLRLSRYLETELVFDLIDENKQIGLTGELILLEKMIKLARAEEDLTEQDALSCWQGFESEFEETRDFGNSDSKVIIEAKMTKDAENRSHLISNWKQLWVQNGESLYVFSGSIRPQKTGEYYWTKNATEIEECLDNHALIVEFRKKMETQGVPVEQWNSYKGESHYMKGFEFALIKIPDEMKILRSDSFADGFGPDDEGSVIREPQYTLDLGAQEKINIDTEEFNEILIRMMKAQ